MMPQPIYEKIALVGIGLIGSSLARVVRREGLAGHIAVATRSAATLALEGSTEAAQFK